MCKKLWVAALAVGVGLLLIGTPVAGWLVGHAKVCCSRMGQSIEENTPIEWEISRLEAQLPELKSDIDTNRKKIVTEEVALENLREQIKADKVALDKQKADLRVLADLVDADTKLVTYKGVTMSKSTAADRLDSALATAKTSEKALESKQKTLDSRERALAASRDRLESMKATHAKLKNDIEQLKAEYAELQAQKAQAQVPVDDSKTAALAQNVAKLKDRMKVETRLAAEDAALPSGTPDRDRKDVVKDAREFLNKDAPKTVEK